MKRSVHFLASAVLAIVLFSCSKSNESDVSQNPGNNPGGGTGGSCDTTNMKFVANVKPILQSSCYACHSNANFSISGVKLENYADLKTHVDDSSLIGTITHAAGFPPMPQGGGKLSDCNINKIRSWINHGAQNN